MPPTKKVVSDYRYQCIVTYDNPVRQLRKCLNKISKPSRRSRIEWFELEVCEVGMTRTILQLLVQVLNHPLPKARSAAESKWDLVTFDEQDLTNPMTDDEASCSQEDIQTFASSLARRTLRLALCESPEILECLSNTPQVEMNGLSIRYSRINSLDCARLTNFVQSCVSLRIVEIDVFRSALDDRLSLVDGLANAFHLHRISFTISCYAAEYAPAALSDVLVRDGGNGIFRFLVSPQSRLQELAMEGVHLEDRHFLQIVDLLPTSQLQTLNVSDNKIGSQGILSFARQLPRIKSLKEVNLRGNPGTNYWHDRYEECLTALLHGMMENHSIEMLSVSQLEPRLKHWILAKTARRIILETTDPIPVGLIPWILERVGTRKWSFHNRHSAQAHSVNALYFVLQNSPILCSASMRRIQRKRRRVDRYH